MGLISSVQPQLLNALFVLTDVCVCERVLGVGVNKLTSKILQKIIEQELFCPACELTTTIGSHARSFDRSFVVCVIKTVDGAVQPR